MGVTRNASSEVENYLNNHRVKRAEPLFNYFKEQRTMTQKNPGDNFEEAICIYSRQQPSNVRQGITNMKEQLA